MFEPTGLPVTDWICVTEEGIGKVPDFKISRQGVSVISAEVKDRLGQTIIRR